MSVNLVIKTDKDVSMHYPCTNEIPAVFRRLLGERKFKKVGGICSGGEIGLFVLLERTEEQLVLVDHCWSSMLYALVKYGALKHLGAKETWKLVTTGMYGKKGEENAWKDILDSLDLPKEAKTSEILFNGLYLSMNGTRRVWEQHFTVKDLKNIESKLDLVTFVHGDIQDIKDYGPFDLLYLSNALDYTNRDKVFLNVKDIRPLTTPRGVVLSTSAAGFGKTEHTSEHGGMWTHRMYQFKPRQKFDLKEDDLKKPQKIGGNPFIRFSTT